MFPSRYARAFCVSVSSEAKRGAFRGGEAVLDHSNTGISSSKPGCIVDILHVILCRLRRKGPCDG